MQVGAASLYSSCRHSEKVLGIPPYFISLLIGYGSNLTIDGTVECDAAITSGCGEYFGSVGAVSGEWPTQSVLFILNVHAKR